MPAASHLVAAKAANENENWENAGVPDAKDFKFAMVGQYFNINDDTKNMLQLHIRYMLAQPPFEKSNFPATTTKNKAKEAMFHDTFQPLITKWGEALGIPPTAKKFTHLLYQMVKREMFMVKKSMKGVKRELSDSPSAPSSPLLAATPRSKRPRHGGVY
jgi:hypothetical protein